MKFTATEGAEMTRAEKIAAIETTTNIVVESCLRAIQRGATPEEAVAAHVADLASDYPAIAFATALHALGEL